MVFTWFNRCKDASSSNLKAMRNCFTFGFFGTFTKTNSLTRKKRKTNKGGHFKWKMAILNLNYYLNIHVNYLMHLFLCKNDKFAELMSALVRERIIFHSYDDLRFYGEYDTNYNKSFATISLKRFLLRAFWKIPRIVWTKKK